MGIPLRGEVPCSTEEKHLQIDLFKEVLVPVIGGLGIFMLGLEFMSNGINNLAAHRMRDMLGRIAGTPVKGLMAGTFITGILQSSTAMTVMVVGLVNAGVVGLRPAISVIMGANIGTTLGNGLIALPLGSIGLLLAGIFALVHVFGKEEKTKNIALACMGFALIFYGLNLLTGGLKPLRNLPEVMSVISALRADSFGGLIACVLTAAGITAMIHSSSATIGIVMGLGAAGVLDWQTAVAFSLGADLGTTITSWMASLNLSKSAKRAAYAHISFNIIGVAVMLPLFFPSMELLRLVMGFFGGDPGVPVMDGDKETFPLVPVAVGIYSIGFNIFNTVLLFPFINVFERVLLKLGHTAADDEEDYSVARHLQPAAAKQLDTGLAAVAQEMGRYAQGLRLFLRHERHESGATDDPHELHTRLDSLNRQIRRYTASMLEHPNLTPQQTDLLASLIEEEDFSATLADSLYQLARRLERQPLAGNAGMLAAEVLERIDTTMAGLLEAESAPAASDRAARQAAHEQTLLAWRARVLAPASGMDWEARGALLALLGSAERALFVIDRIHAERASVSRQLVRAPQAADAAWGDGDLAGQAA